LASQKATSRETLLASARQKCKKDTSMKKIKLTLLAFLVFVSLNAQKKSLNEKLIACMNEPKFQSWFRICEKEIDTIYIYDNTQRFINFEPIKISCNKILVAKKSSIKIDVNIFNPNNTDKIVLYNYEVKKGIHSLHFLNILSNSNMVLEINSENKIVNYSTGSF
jgi:hypothetical protein